MTRKGLGILGGAIVVLFGALLVAPSLIDWTSYKDGLAARLEAVIGRRVSIDGAISLALLPSPTFVAERVRLADGAEGDIAVTVPRLELRPQLLPLIRGRVEIATLVLQSPDIHFRRWPQGRAAADHPKAMGAMPPAPAAGVSPGPAAPVEAEVPPVFLQAFVPRNVGSLIVENGTFVYEPPGHMAWLLDKVSASFSGQQGGGARLVGSARLGEAEFSFDALQGSLSAGNAPFSLSITTTEGGGVLRFGGQLAGTGTERKVKGKLTLKAPDPARIAKDLGGAAAVLPLPVGNLSLAAAVTGSEREVDLESVVLSLGGVEGLGNASVTFGGTPQFDVKLGFSRLDLDALLSGRRSAPAQPPATPKPSVRAAAGELAATPESSLLPAGVSVALDLGAEVTVFHGGLLRGAHLNAVLANGEVTVNQASLSLPGNTDVNLFGFLVGTPDGPSFDGSFEAGSDDLRGLLDWLKLDVSRVPGDRLHAARLSGKVKIRPDVIDFDGTQLRLDGTRMDAAATVHLGDRPAVGASFVIDSLNADAYWPKAGPKEPAVSVPKNGPDEPAPAELSGGMASAWLDRLDANVKGRITQVMARGVNGQNVTVDGSWKDGHLVLRDLSVGDFAGAQMHVDGTIDGLAGAIPTVKGLHYVLRAKQLGRLFRQTGLWFPFDADRLGAVAASGTLDGGTDGLIVDARVEAAGGGAAVSGRIDGLPSAPKYDLGLEVSHASTVQLAHLAFPDYRPAGNLGAFAAAARLVGAAPSLQLNDLRVKAGPASVAGEARLQLGDRPRLEATLTTGDVPADAYLQAAGRSSAKDLPPPPPPKSEHKGLPDVATDKVSAAPRAVVATGAIGERWSHDPLDFSWSDSFDATLKLDAKAITFGRLRLEAVTAGVELTAGNIALQQLVAQLYGGKLTGDGRLSNDGKADLHLGLSHAQMRDALLGVADVGMVDGAMDGEVSVSTSGRSTAEWLARLRGTGKIAVGDGVIRGFDLKAVDDRLRGVDSPTSLLALLQAGLTGGKTHFSSLTGALRADNGLVTIDDMQLTADGGGAKAFAQINLPAAMMDGRAEFHLASAPSGPPLVMRLSGPLDAPRRFVDINEIQQWLVSRGKAKAKDIVKGALGKLGR
ncbi:AsmA family protein [Telmatospirillum sp.]|uniref:AsmA family protein n=1 Tax=Telmatospirillum sp. TaxID=2079197 RepID=UPI0028462D2A|nr:AsmA family protein [Telmatospirillum sp.]MDR3437686.1 AsmA family protein [Telmatospirillum sp.]